jgi:hypothetical protein
MSKTRSSRRRHLKDFGRLFTDDCSLCHTPYAHGASTSSGYTKEGVAAVVGECCVAKLVSIEGFGVYLADADRRLATLAKRAGLPDAKPVYDGTSAWNIDDRQWFKNNPTRSHRLRPTFPGETFGKERVSLPALPPGRTDAVLVRQVEPGMRIRIPIDHDVGLPIPDVEAILHALFDAHATQYRTRVFRPISAREVAEQAKKYAAGGRA